MTTLLRTERPPAAEPPAKTVTHTLSPARNPERLHLLLDPTRVFGWISGTKGHFGETVTVITGGREQTIAVGRGNTFRWPYKVAKATRIEFVVAGLTKTIEVQPPSALPPCVFFVVDRGVYRPKQTLRFAAFLRDLDERGEFVPRAAQTVEVHLTSEHKKTTAARLKLTADWQGRLLGEYTFSDADPLDTYRLSIPNYKGEAHVRLAEYRKTKVRLEVLSRRQGGQLQLRFRAIDYLDNPVKKARVEFLAQIVHEPAHPAAAALDAKQFAYAGDNRPPTLRLEDLTNEERLLADADASFDPIGGLNVGQQREVVGQSQGKLILNARGEGVQVIELRKGWLKPGYTVVVRGVLIDGDGREERRTKTIALTKTDDSLQLTLPKSTFNVNEPIRVTARRTDAARLDGSGTLVAMRLSLSAPAGMMGMGGGSFRGFGSMSGFSGPGTFGSMGGRMMGFTVPVMADWSAIRRELATALVFKGDTAVLRLKEPGAYMLTAIWHKRDGTRLRQEIGCTVCPSHDVPALSLQLDRDAYQSGDTLTGSIHSKYADACVLLTLRDSAGFWLWQTIRLSEGRGDIKLKLPAGIHYGCAVEVMYADDADDDEPVQVASRLIHVVPTRRMLAIRSTIKPTLEPGEKAVLDLRLNRKEPVDLIVSVYDKALLNIAADPSTDIRAFYLADDRVQDTQAREILRRRLDAVTLDDLFKQSRGWLKEYPDKRMTAEGVAMQTLVINAESKQLRTADVATLLRVAGLKTRAIDALHTWTVPDPAQRRRLTFWRWLDTAAPDGWRLHFALIGDAFFVTAYHAEQNPAPWNAKAIIPRPYYYSMNGGGMMGMGGFGGGIAGNGLGGLGGIGGIAGLGGGGFAQPRMGMMGGSPGVFGGGSSLGTNFAPQFLVQRPKAYKPRASALDAGDDGPALSIRRDFADSAYWNAKLRTDADGKARVEFKLPDSLTGWQVVVTAISKDMHVGRHETSFRTARPLMVTPILPRFFTEGDKVRVSANVQNRTGARQTIRVRLKAENGKVDAPADKEITLDAHGSASVSWDFQAGDAGEEQLLVRAESKAGSDASLKKLPVIAAGVEHIVTASGFCKESATIKLPDGVDASRVVFEVRFLATLVADLLDTLPYLVEYPYGCVEQTMSRFLPAIEVAQILKQLHREDPELTRKLPGCVDAGIKRLLELQHEDGGWGWWTNDATHEFMTPYALYGLIEAEKAGYRIGRADAIPRGLKRLEEFIEQNGVEKPADRIFCLYIYGQRQPLRADWWDYIARQRGSGKLSDYALALALELAVKQKHSDLAASLADDLRGRAHKSNGRIHWRTGHFARWDDDPFEVSAAALKALVAFDKNDKLIPGVVAYFMATKRDKRWNSTKDTALIVHALCDYLASEKIEGDGRPSVAFRCNDGVEQKISFAQSSEIRTAIVPAKQVRPGDNRVTFSHATPGMMYRIAVRYWVRGRKAPAESHGITVVRRWWLLDEKGKRNRELKPGDEVPRGAYLESTVEAQPEDGDGTMRFVLVENPRPASCEVLPSDDKRFEQQGTPCLLREDREQRIAFHHDRTTGRIIDRCVLHAELVGEYLVSPAQVEMMYKTEVRGHSGTFAFRVADK
jgi:hypothetical protein